MKIIFEKYRYEIELSILCFLMTVLSAVANRANMGGVLSFWLFMLCGIIIPGTALFRILRINGSTRLEALLFSYTMGYILSMLLYSLTVFLKIGAYYRWIYAGITLISLIILKYLKKESYYEIANKREERTWIILLSVLFCVSLIIFSLKNALPTFLESNSWHNDILYWIGDIVSLSHSVPPVNFRTLDLNYYYHYFGALQVSAIVKMTGISAAEVAIQYSYIEAMIMLGLSSLCLTMRVFKEFKATMFTLFLLLASTGFENLTVVTWFWHIYQVPMGFNIALSLEMVVVLLILIQLKKEKIDFSIMIFSLVCLFICTGTKGPVGAIALCGIGITCLRWLFADKQYKKAFCYGMLAIIVWGCIYVTLLMPGNSLYMQTSSYVDPYKISLGNTLIVNCKIFVWKTLKYFRYIALVNPWIFVPAGLYICYAVIKRKLKFEDIIFFVMIVVGSVLGYVFHYYGSSQVYFTLAVFPFGAILSGKFWREIYVSLKGKEWRICSIRIGIITMIFLILLLDYHGNWKNTLQTCIKNGLLVLEGITPEYESKNSIMTKEEYEAYRWISDNTDPDALFLSDRSLEEEIFCYIPGAFSERYMYSIVGAYMYIDLGNNELEKAKKCFQGDKDAIEYYIDKGTNYIVQSTRISPTFSCPEEYGEKVYDNGTIMIWKIRE